MSDSFVKKPCKNCPYRSDVTPYLHPDRGSELAYHVTNQYNEFTCHQTLEHDDEDGETFVGKKSKTCAGFLTLMANELGEEKVPSGFKPSYDICYIDAWDMSSTYEEQAEIEKQKEKNR